MLVVKRRCTFLIVGLFGSNNVSLLSRPPCPTVICTCSFDHHSVSLFDFYVLFIQLNPISLATSNISAALHSQYTE